MLSEALGGSRSSFLCFACELIYDDDFGFCAFASPNPNEFVSEGGSRQAGRREGFLPPTIQDRSVTDSGLLCHVCNTYIGDIVLWSATLAGDLES